MKTLILSCNTGEGHNSCAKAIKEYFDSKKEVCIIQDGLEFISPRVSDVVSRGHSFIYRRIPFLFKYGYEYSEKHPKLYHEGSSLYKFFTQGTERIFDYICEGQFDVVICTHVFTALMMTDILKRHPMKLTTCFVATDYTCSPSTKDSNLDFYFIPGHEFATDFECSTITEDKLIASGIPVRQMFYDSSEKEPAGVCYCKKNFYWRGLLRLLFLRYRRPLLASDLCCAASVPCLSGFSGWDSSDRVAVTSQYPTLPDRPAGTAGLFYHFRYHRSPQ